MTLNFINFIISIFYIKSTLLIDSLTFNQMDIAYFLTTLPVLTIKPKRHKTPITLIQNKKTDCTAITLSEQVHYPWYLGNIGLRFTQLNRDIVNLPLFAFYLIIGHLLGDGSIFYNATGKAPYFTFSQSIHRMGYFLYSYSFISWLCESLPLFSERFRFGKNLYSFKYNTRCLPCLSWIHSLFYTKINGRWVKSILPRASDDLILYFHPIVLAFWTMDDGTKIKNTIVLCTNGFTWNDVYKLAGMLHYVYGLECTVRSSGKGHPEIYIRTGSAALFRSIVLPYMHPSMMYKLGL